MKMAKRALAVVLSLVMAFSVFSIVGSAAMNTTKVYEGNGNTITQGLDIFKVVDGTPVETELASGSNLEPGDVIEVRVKIGTDFYAQSVSNHICYDSTIFAPYLNGARYTTVDTANYGTNTGFFKTYEDSVQKVDGLTWYDTLMSDANNGRIGTTNTQTELASDSVRKGAKNQYTPLSWKVGGKASGEYLEEYEKYHFISTKYVSSSDAPSGGQLIKVPYDTYFSFQLQVLDDAATAEGETTSVWIPYDAIKTKSNQACHKVTAETNGTNTYSTSNVVGYGHTVDLTDGEVEFTVGAGAVTPEPEQYTVTFVAGDNGALEGTTEVTVDEGTAWADVSLPTAVADAGYKFAGWQGAPETVTGDVTVTATFEYDAEQWATVTFAAGENGSIADAEAVTVLKGTDASAIEFPEATADAGYKFAGWDLTGAITADVTATANFELDAEQWATVTFAAGENGSIADAEAVTVLKGTDASAIEFPEATADAGYKFAGWDLTGAIEADVTATANFELDASQWVTVTFAAGANGSIADAEPVTVLKGTAWADITFPEATADAGYAFAGWDNAGETVEADVTVTASFTATDATVTVNVYTMDTTGAYGAPSTTTFTATVGSEASVNAADYEAEGFYVDTEKSLLAVESVSANGATLEVYVARTVATYTFLVPDGDSFTQYEQEEYYYGAEVVLPVDPTVDGFTFMGWKTDDGADFTGGTAGVADVTVTAVLEVADTSLTEEDLAALSAAIDLLPDPENLYYYTDEAILNVAKALGSTETDADAYIAAAIAATTYAYEGEQSKAAVVAATEAITELASSINSWVDGKMPNRDESKANINIDVVPVAVNGEDVEADADNKIVINKGDIVTFNFNLTTDYYLSALYAQILYDTNLFDLVDVDDYVYTEEQIQDGEAYAEYILETTSDRNISRNYDIACESVNSYDKQYHASVKDDADFKAQYKIILISVMTKAAANSKAFKFDDAYIASFRLQATEDVVYDGTISSLVGVDADWYADADNKSELLAGTRGTGYKADGTTVANKATSNKYSWNVYDNYAQYGQTFTSTMANVQFGAAAAPVEQYTVTFVAGENGALAGTTEVTVDEGTAFAEIALPTVVADAGYKFAGWQGAPETITGDVTVTATFEYDAEQWVTVTFAAGENGSIANAEAITVIKGAGAEGIKYPEATADAGYKFVGWDLTGRIEADVTATAIFEYDASQWATVTFAAGANGSIADAEAVTVLKGTDASEIEFPEATADAGYKFAGWDLTGAIEADVTATATFEYDAEQWATVTFAAGENGSIADAEAVTVLKGTDASAIEFPAATADAGYKFDGWDLTGAIEADVTATAIFKYDAEQWALVVFAAGENGSIEGGPSDLHVLKGTAWADIEFPEATADAGYKFVGWDLNGETVTFDVDTAIAKFEYDAEQWATVTFAAGENGSIADAEPVTVLKGTAFAEIELPATQADAGYKFAAWENAPETITEDVTVTATFVVDNDQYATVTFAAGENGSIADAEPVEVLKGTAWSEIEFPEATADAGYAFAGWDIETNAVEADVTVTAIFEYDASQWATVTFAAGDNGSIADAEAVTVLKGTDAAEIEFPEATADAGYAFAGWDLEGAIEADVTATAIFEYDAEQWATVTFAAGENGSIADVEPVTVLKGTSIDEIAFPEATADAGYEFAGWDFDGETIDADITITALFTEIDTSADVLWAGYEEKADGSDADAETIYVIAKKKGTGALKIQIRDAQGTLTYARANAAVVSISDINYLDTECELWVINRALYPATFTAVAKYEYYVSIDAIPAELGYEFTVEADVPVYDDAIISAEIANVGEYDGTTEQTITIVTGLDVFKVQLLNNYDNGTMTYGRVHNNVTVEEVDGKLVWTITKVFAVGNYSYSVLAKSLEGWADSDIDLEFTITEKKPENNAPVVTVEVVDCVPTATVVTSANVRKVKFTNVENGSTFTYSKTSAAASVVENEDGTLTWTITLPTHGAKVFNYNVAALLGSVYSEATLVTFTVTK